LIITNKTAVLAKTKPLTNKPSVVCKNPEPELFSLIKSVKFPSTIPAGLK
jgi:hypothetical protein